MSKQGICENCKRGPMTLVAKGLCWTCYKAADGLSGVEREMALQRTAERLKEKPIKRFRKRQKEKSDHAAAHQHIPDMASGMPVPDTQRKGAPNEIYDKITLAFTSARDCEIRDMINDQALRDRRTPDQQIMYMLDGLVAAGIQPAER